MVKDDFLFLLGEFQIQGIHQATELFQVNLAFAFGVGSVKLSFDRSFGVERLFELAEFLGRGSSHGNIHDAHQHDIAAHNEIEQASLSKLEIAPNNVHNATSPDKLEEQAVPVHCGEEFFGDLDARNLQGHHDQRQGQGIDFHDSRIPVQTQQVAQNTRKGKKGQRRATDQGHEANAEVALDQTLGNVVKALSSNLGDIFQIFLCQGILGVLGSLLFGLFARGVGRRIGQFRGFVGNGVFCRLGGCLF
mmetsp:Transcript_598/g.1742  ORF Transcript_598/g.1742 Transcript_598/m.1742 type:complete len:248 (-) Transcript_598:116-859(-)